MKKLIASVIAISLYSTCPMSFAYEASKGVKILSQTSLCIGFKECKLVPHDAQKKSAKTMFAGAHVYIDNFVIKVKKIENVWSVNSAYITNITDKDQIYTLIYSLTCGEALSSFSEVISIPAGGDYSEDADNFAAVQFETEGSYPIYSSFDITGAQTSDDQANNFVKVVS